MQVGRPTNVQVGGKQTDRQMDKTNRHACRQTGRPTDKEVFMQVANRQTDRQTDKTNRHADQQMCR